MTRRRGHGEGSIQRRADGRWAAVVDLGFVDGRRRRKTVYGRTRQEVAHKLTDLLKARSEGMPIPSGNKRVDVFLSEWLEAIKPTVRPRTWQRYEQYVRLHAVPNIGRYRLITLAPHHLQQLYAQRLERGLSPQTVLHLHRMLHKALGQALRLGLVARNVTDLVDPPRASRKTMRTLSSDEVRRLLRAAAEDRRGALYVLAVTAGLREGELLGLRWRDVDLDGRRVRVVGSMQVLPGVGLTIVEPKTAGSRRQVVITDLAADALRRHRAGQAEQRLAAGDEWDDHDLVFPNAFGRPITPSNLYRAFQAFLRRAELPRVRLHDLRHTAATLLLEQGVHPKIVSEMLGHTTIGITLDLYSHVTPTMQAQAARALDELFGRQFGRQTRTS
jgi:integrase